MSLREYWFPLYPSKWIGDTVELTLEQEGLYWRLCLYYMDKKVRLPATEAARARIAGVPLDVFTPIWEVIHRFFHREDDGRYSHKKCDEILQLQEKQSKVYNKRAKKAAKKRWSKGLENQGELSFEDALSMPEAEENNAIREEKRIEESISSSPSQPTNLKTPLTPTTGKAGFSTSSQGGGGRPFSMENWMLQNPAAAHRILSRMLDRCPDWDRTVLVKKYDATVSTRGGAPQNPESAFLGWIEKFYAGKKP